MSYSLKQLRSIPDEKLVVEHDRVAPPFQTNPEYYVRELSRRDQDKQTKTMMRYTYWITIMTAVMTVATIINLFVAFR